MCRLLVIQDVEYVIAAALMLSYNLLPILPVQLSEKLCNITSTWWLMRDGVKPKVLSMCTIVCCFYTCIRTSFPSSAAPSAPPAMREVRDIGAHWAVVGWGIPPEAGRNGIIISYIVQLLDTHGAVVWNETVAVQNPTFDSPQSLAHNLTSLKPYTRYVWRVAATTTAGTGPFSSIDTMAYFHTLQRSE